MLEDVLFFTVAAGEDRAWLLDSTPEDGTDLWTIGSDGSLTGPTYVPGGGYAHAFGDGLALAELASSGAEVMLLDGDGSVEHEITLFEGDAGSVEGATMQIMGESGGRLWIETQTTTTQVFAVSESGDVEEIPYEQTDVAVEMACVVDGEIVAVRQRMRDEDDEDNGPFELVHNFISIESFTNGEWHSVPGGERTIVSEGGWLRPDCQSSSITFIGDIENGPVVRWAPGIGWEDVDPDAWDDPPETVDFDDGCCAWTPANGSVLLQHDDGSYQPTGVELRDPDSGNAEPDEADGSTHGATFAACAKFPVASGDRGPVVCDRSAT